MKIEQLKEYVNPRTIQELEIPIERAIVHEEFNKRGYDAECTDSRERAVDRLIRMRVPFNSEWNTTFHLADKFIEGKCPYCKGPMDAHHGGGSGSQTNIEFRCLNNECGATVEIRVNWDAISVRPPKEGKYNPRD